MQARSLALNRKGKYYGMLTQAGRCAQFAYLWIFIHRFLEFFIWGEGAMQIFVNYLFLKKKSFIFKKVFKVLQKCVLKMTNCFYH